jgi:hypothetical protein
MSLPLLRLLKAKLATVDLCALVSGKHLLPKGFPRPTDVEFGWIE